MKSDIKIVFQFVTQFLSEIIDRVVRKEGTYIAVIENGVRF